MATVSPLQRPESPPSDPFEFAEVIKEVDSIIAKCMTDITHKDREQTYLTVHGISDDNQETPALVESSLKEMKAQIEKIPGKNALELAQQMDKEYVDALYLKFIRAERFNAALAASKFVQHFELKMELFGQSKLCKDIEQEDLSENDIKALYSGYVQWLPLRDISGRTVTIVFPAASGPAELSSVSKVRMFFYMRMVAMEDEAFQKKGFVSVMSTGNFESDGQMDTYSLRTHVRELHKASVSLPGYTQCMHFCFPNLISISSFLLFSFARFTIAVCDNLMAVRYRIHKGSSQQECVSKLAAFGIPVSVIPNSPSDNDYHVTLMQRRKRLELKRRQRRQRQSDDGSKSVQSDPTMEEVEDSDSDDGFTVSFDPLDEKCKWICSGPGPKDVILGRGRKTNNHAGNIRLRIMVEELIEVYKTKSKKEKKEITQRIVLAIQTNGRFLKESEMFGWVEVPDEVARIKVSHAFRDCNKLKKKKTSDDDNNTGKTLSGQKRGL